jgi:hypothetical protein
MQIKTLRGEWITLPDSDGFFSNRNGWSITFDEIHQYFKLVLDEFDRLPEAQKAIIREKGTL